MEWLWLFLGIVGLALLWLLIMWVEKLAQRLKVHDEERRLASADIAERTAQAEAELIEKQATKDVAMDIIENGEIDTNNPEEMAIFREAVDALNTQELIQAVSNRVFGAPQDTKIITANQSAFDHLQQPRKVVAQGEGITPVKVKPAEKSGLSKAEQKMLKKIKQGD